MIDFLKNYGITDGVVREIEKVNSSANLYNFSCNQDEVVKIIEFLKELKINCIEQLLIHRIDIFFMSCDELKNLFSKQDLNKLVQLINEDYAAIDDL